MTLGMFGVILLVFAVAGIILAALWPATKVVEVERDEESGS